MHILLVEPDFKYVKYPPLGLLKLATYYRNAGHTCALVRKKEVYKGIDPDVVCITSLFTYSWEPVIKTYYKYKNFYPKANFKIGGIYASLLPDHIKEYCAEAEIFSGAFEELDNIMPAWDLVPNWNSSIIFTSRGCPKNCAFCSVKTIEPNYRCFDIDLESLIYPNHQKLIIQDNNILADKMHWNKIYNQLQKLTINIDFNQGLDVKYIDWKTANELKSIKLPIVRIAYDTLHERNNVLKAIDNLKSAGFRGKNIMVYTLFNFHDSPDNFLARFKDLLEYEVVCYPMKYEPNNSLKKNSYISEYWSEDDLEMIADARRVLGWGGAFIPHEGLRKKILKAKTFYEAFELREKSLV